MQKIFLIALAGLLCLSGLSYFSLPEQRSDKPILSWGMQADAVRQEVRERYYNWREERGLEPVELLLDGANRKPDKVMMQGVSGVGNDLVAIPAGYFQSLQSAGVLADITEEMARFGAIPEATYAGIRSELVVGERQYAFPWAAATNLMWVNVDLFQSLGLEPPPERWTIDEFEALGKAFVERANPPGRRDRVYFLSFIPRSVIRRSIGIDLFNETLTASGMYQPEMVRLMERMRRWVREDYLVPSAEAELAFASDQTGFRLKVDLFARGQYGILPIGRWASVLIRQMDPFALKVVEPFHGGFPNVALSADSVGVYAKAKHPEIAASFLGFLISEAYNLTVVESGESLPPIPAYTEVDAFLYPEAHPNEWNAHKVFAKASRQIGICESRSPFVLPNVVLRLDTDAFNAMMAGVLTADESVARTEARINAEIAISLEANPALRPRYEAAVERQREIDRLKANGAKIPAELIDNPFYLEYYRRNGQLAEASPGEGLETAGLAERREHSPWKGGM